MNFIRGGFFGAGSGGGGGGGGGEANTASNLGAGEGVFASKLGVDLRFKSLLAGAGISLSSDADEITIAAIAAALGWNQETIAAENVSGSDTVLADGLDNQPVDAASVLLIVNGEIAIQGINYNVVGGTNQGIEWLGDLTAHPLSFPLEDDDIIRAYYPS